MKFAIKSGLVAYITTYPDLIPDFSRPRLTTPTDLVHPTRKNLLTGSKKST